jgi:signal transduction histidine kinase
MAFRIDLEGRLAKIRLGAANSLQALFEAVANAAEAVESNGRVTIRVLRDESSPVMQTRTEALGRHNLVGFEVADNGVGFDPANSNPSSTPTRGTSRPAGGRASAGCCG